MAAKPQLEDYYEQELRYLRELGSEYAKAHPERASMLRLGERGSDDPHVERLLEGFAFLAARIHRRLDDGFDGFCRAMLEAVSPDVLRPVPPLAIARFLGNATVPPTGHKIDRGDTLVASAVEGVRCRFRTCYETTLWPIEVTAVDWLDAPALVLGESAGEASGCLRVRLETQANAQISDLTLQSLRFYLNADFTLATALYEALLNDCVGVAVRTPEEGGFMSRLGVDSIKPVGFGRAETLLPTESAGFAGHSMLLEYFALSEKHLFIEVEGLGFRQARISGSEVELHFLFRTLKPQFRQELLRSSVTESTLCLGCTPIVNLFDADADPVRLDARDSEHVLRVGGTRGDRQQAHIYSVDSVWAISPERPVRRRLPTFFEQEDGAQSLARWQTIRRPSVTSDAGPTETVLVVSGNHEPPGLGMAPSIMTKVTAHNGSLPSKLPLGQGETDLDLKGGGAPVEAIRLLTRPTPPQAPSWGTDELWESVSRLSMNYLSVADEDGQMLRRVLHAHDVAATDRSQSQISAIRRVSRRPGVARLRGPLVQGFARGHEVEIELDESAFSGGALFLFASVLERFLGLQTSLNSFARTTAIVWSRGRGRELRKWSPRSGSSPCL